MFTGLAEGVAEPVSPRLSTVPGPVHRRLAYSRDPTDEMSSDDDTKDGEP